MFNRLVQFIRRVVGHRSSPSTIPPLNDAAPPHESSPDITVQLDSTTLTLGSVEIYDAPLEGKTILFRPISDDSADEQYYRDEDGEVRPVRQDCAPLTAMTLEALAVEYISAASDAESMPDALERQFLSALRDSYGRELWRRVMEGGTSRVHIGGRHYEIIPLPVHGCVRMVTIE